MTERRQNQLKIWAPIIIPSLIGGLGSLLMYWMNTREAIAIQTQINITVEKELNQKVNREIFDLTTYQNSTEHQMINTKLDKIDLNMGEIKESLAGGHSQYKIK